MNRRAYLQWMMAAAVSCKVAKLSATESGGGSFYKQSIPLSQEGDILERVNKYRPLATASLPPNLKERLGAAHADGKYHLSSEPFLIEGTRKLSEFGFGAAKLWFETYADEYYPFNSDWSKLKRKDRLVDIAKHPYYLEAFDFPFSTFALEITHLYGARPFNAANNDYAEYEEQFEELTAYLYERYSDRPVTFILQNWEGDWLFFGKFVEKWDKDMLGKLPDRIDRFTRWFAARQRGVERARLRAIKNGTPRCRVLHAVEVNQVLACNRGEPTLTETVLPNIAPDLISWSCYDGLKNIVATWHGIEIIRHFMQTSKFLPEPTIMIGEVGIPEQSYSQEEIFDFWDRTMSVFLALDIPLIFQWELYCNELTKEAATRRLPKTTSRPPEDLRGFWLFRPDGSLSHSGTFWKELISRSR